MTVSKITGFAQFLKRNGVEIKSMTKNWDGAFNVVLKDGRKGRYCTQKNSQGLRQRINLNDGKEIMFDTTTNSTYGVTIANKGKETVIPQRMHFGTVHESGRYTNAELTKVTPFANRHVQQQDGSWKQTVSNLVEQHSDNLLGQHIVMPNDRLIGPQGQYLQIFQRSPHSTNGINLDEILNTYYKWG